MEEGSSPIHDDYPVSELYEQKGRDGEGTGGVEGEDEGVMAEMAVVLKSEVITEETINNAALSVIEELALCLYEFSDGQG